MTETVSHIIRRLNWIDSNNNPYKVLPNVNVKDVNHCLNIDESPCVKKIVTNDVVIISKTSFNLLGRVDNIIAQDKFNQN